MLVRSDSRYSCSRELGHENLHGRIFCSSCKLQNLHSSKCSVRFSSNLYNRSSRNERQNPIVFPSFSREIHRKNIEVRYQNLSNGQHFSFPCILHSLNGREILRQNENSCTNHRGSLAFVRCQSGTIVSPTKNAVNGRKKTYGGVLPSILRSLESEEDVVKILDSCPNLSPKEQTVILKEQSSWKRALCIFEWMKSQEEYIPNVIHYNIVLRSLGKAQRWDELRLCWVEMARNGVLPTNNTYGMLVDVYGKAGLVKEALLWIKHMRLRAIFPDEITMSTVVRVLKDAEEFDRADKFYKDWCVGRVDLEDIDMDAMVDSTNQSGLIPISFKHFLSTELFKTGGRLPPPGNMTSSNIENGIQKPRLTSTYNTLIDLYGKAGRLKDAAEVFAEMLRSGVALDTVTFNTMIYICGTHDHLSEGESLFHAMEGKGIQPDTKTYNIFLSLYAYSGNINASLDCYRKIRGAGLFPDIVTHRALLLLLCERNMVEEVENVIEEIANFEACIDEHSLPVIIKMYVNLGLLDKANALLDNFLLAGGISPKIRAAIIDVYADKGLWVEAERVFFGKREFLGQKKDVLEYNVMIKAYGKAKLYDKAFSLFKEMRNHGTWPDDYTYNSLIQMFSGGDRVDQAMELLTEMQGAGFKPQCQTFSALIRSYTRLCSLSDAVNLYEEMRRVGVEPNEVVYGSLIDGFAESGKVEAALHYFHIMEEHGISPNKIVMTSLIKAYSKVGRLDEAKKLYEKMEDLEGGPDTVASNSMISRYANLGMISEGKLVFEKMKAKGSADRVSFSIMMQLYQNMGMRDEANDIAEEMKRSGFLRDCASYNTIISYYAMNGELSKCGEFLHEMVKLKILPDSWTFKVLFNVLKKGGIPIEAVTQMESSIQEGKAFAREIITTSVYSVAGLHELALEFCKIFMDASKVELDSCAYNVAIYSYSNSGDIDKALNIFTRMQCDGLEPDLVTYINLVGCYGKAGMVEGVKRVYGLLKFGEVEPNESLFKAIIGAYRNASRHDLAELVNQEMKFLFDAQQQHPFSEESEPSSEEERNP